MAGALVIGVDVGDSSRIGSSAVIASHKAPTSSDVTLSVQATLSSLLGKSTTNRKSIFALAIGTTHFINAIVERDSSRVERVAILRLASYNFSSGTPPFADWPEDLKSIVYGHSAIIPGGCNIDGKLIHAIDNEAVRDQAEIIRQKGIKNVVIVGIGSPTDTEHDQEEHVKAILREVLDDNIHIVCSREIAGSGLLARENAAILNASILSFAQRTIRSFINAMGEIGLQCPLYLTSNAGHLLPFSEAMQYPIRIFSSGATNSIRGAAFLAGSDIGPNGCIVVDIGGTTTDVGYLLKNGYPRLAKTYTDLAGVKVNLEIPSVESIGLGGGSLLYVDKQRVLIGPDSVGHGLLERALCFGGDIATATDMAVANGAQIGTTKVELPEEVVTKALARVKLMLEKQIDRSKLSPDPCTIILVGGGSILCPQSLHGVNKIVCPEHAGVANAIGAAMAKISASVEVIVKSSEVSASLAKAKVQAVQQAVLKGGDDRFVTVLDESIIGVPYTDGQKTIRVEIACPADHGKVKEAMKEFKTTETSASFVRERAVETKTHHKLRQDSMTEPKELDISGYRPHIDAKGTWILSTLDLKFLATGCYILGCGGGGSPSASLIDLNQKLLDGEVITLVSVESLGEADVLPPIAAVGTPAVSIERPGGDMVLHALQMMSTEMDISYDCMLAVEIGGSNGMEPLIWGSSKHYGKATVDADLMGRAYPSFEKVSPFITAKDINEIFPVTICSGTGENIFLPANQPDSQTADKLIRTSCVEMGSAAGAVSRPMTGKQVSEVAIPNTYSLAWRLGRAVALAKQQACLSTVTDAIIRESGGPQSAMRVFQGKIRSVESSLTKMAHSMGTVTIERLSEDEMEGGDESGGNVAEVSIPFMNENLAVIARDLEGKETVLATVPDLIFLLDVSTGEAIGVQEYRYGLKVTVMIMAPHTMWTSKRGLEIGGPAAFDLPYEYKSPLVYTKPRSVIEEFRDGGGEKV